MLVINTCSIVSPFSRYNNQILIFVKRTQSPWVCHSKLSKTPFRIKVLTDPLHEFEHMLMILGIVCSLLGFLIMPVYVLSRKSQLLNRENVNCAFVWCASKPLCLDIYRYRIQLCLVAASSKLLQCIASVRIVQSNDGSFLAGGCKEGSPVIEGHAWQLRVVCLNDATRVQRFVFVDVQANRAFVLVRAGKHALVYIIWDCDQSKLVDRGLNGVDQAEIAKVVHVNLLFQNHNNSMDERSLTCLFKAWLPSLCL